MTTVMRELSCPFIYYGLFVCTYSFPGITNHLINRLRLIIDRIKIDFTISSVQSIQIEPINFIDKKPPASVVKICFTIVTVHNTTVHIAISLLHCELYLITSGCITN